MEEKKTQTKKIIGILLLFATALIFGSSYVASSIGMEAIEAFTFNSIRFPLGAISLLPLILWCHVRKTRQNEVPYPGKNPTIGKDVWISGGWMGIALCIAAYLQQTAFKYTTSGKIAFITSLYILFVLLIGIVLRRRVRLITWIGVALGMLGLWFLSFTSSSLIQINWGDVLALACAICYGIHIILIDHFVAKYDPIKLSFVQFFVAGMISVICMFLFERPSFSTICTVILPLIYSGVMSCGLAFTFQTIGQRHISPVVASLIMCTESVFGLLFAALFLSEYPSGREILGCVLMFSAIIIVQFPGYKTKQQM